MFHKIQGRTTEEKAANVRVFVGDGTPFLSVPGLKKVETVRVGGITLADFEQKVPVDSTLTKFEDQKVQMVELVEAEDGSPVLLRNIQSNDGVWQEGVSVYIAGEYDGEEAAPADKPAGKAKADKAPKDGE
jgi:hypothetical protein